MEGLIWQLTDEPSRWLWWPPRMHWGMRVQAAVLALLIASARHKPARWMTQVGRPRRTQGFLLFSMKKPWRAIKQDSAGWCSDLSNKYSVFQDWSVSFRYHLNSNLTPSHFWRSEPSYCDLYFTMVLNTAEVWLQTESQWWTRPASHFFPASPKMLTRT